jgi:hypothetical protein
MTKKLGSPMPGNGTITVIDLTRKKASTTPVVQYIRANRRKFTPDGKLVLVAAKSAIVVLARLRWKKSSVLRQCLGWEERFPDERYGLGKRRGADAERSFDDARLASDVARRLKIAA